MKAKRILSLLLAVAMIVACATVFAGPTGYFQPNAKHANIDDAILQAIEAGASFAEIDKIRADFNVKKISDDEVVEAYGLDSIADAGVEGDLVGNGWTVTVSLEDIGTLVRGSKVGFLMTQVGLAFETKDDAEYVTLPVPYSVNEGLNPEAITMGLGPNGYAITYDGADSKFNNAYPMTTNTTVTNLKDAFTFVVYAAEGTELILGEAVAQFNNIEYKSMAFRGYVEGTTTPFKLAQYALWVPATITLGEAKQEVTPSIDSTTANDQTGVAASNETVGAYTFDNAFAVTVNLTAAAKGTEVGVEFLPEFMGDAWDTAVDTKIYSDEWLGNGGVELKAALINIPRFLAGKKIKINARPYVMVNDAKDHDDIVSGFFTYNLTGEPVAQD